MYKEKARKDYLALAKCRKRGVKKIRKAIKKQLQYIRHDLGYVDNLLENNNVELNSSDAELLDILTTVYEQQLYMFENNTHTVENRIVSISQPYIRPIVRGKAKSSVEFDAKLDLSVDETGMCRLENLSFDAYNESAVLKTAIENYKQRTYQDNTDRIEVERKFSLAKHKFGLGLLLTKREDTTKASIVLSIIAMNID